MDLYYWRLIDGTRHGVVIAEGPLEAKVRVRQCIGDVKMDAFYITVSRLGSIDDMCYEFDEMGAW